MATLDSLLIQTHYTAPRRNADTRTQQRNTEVQYGIASGTDWDLPNRVPLARVQPSDPAVRDNAFPSPPIDQSTFPESFYVPLVRYHKRRVGATEAGIELYDGGRTSLLGQAAAASRRAANVRTWSRFSPYRTGRASSWFTGWY